jgi:hypothetical protein
VTRDQFFFPLEISFRQLRLCYFVAPSLKRGRVCNSILQLLLGLARAVTLGPESRRTHGHEVEVEVNLRPTVSRPVRPGVRHPSGTHDQFFFLLEISFRELRLCYFVAPSLTRGRVCNLLVQKQVPVFISRRNRVTQLYFLAMGTFFRRLIRFSYLR